MKIVHTDLWSPLDPNRELFPALFLKWAPNLSSYLLRYETCGCQIYSRTFSNRVFTSLQSARLWPMFMGPWRQGETRGLQWGRGVRMAKL